MPTPLRPIREIPDTLCPIAGCGSELYVRASWLIPLEVIDRKLRRKDADSSDWELACESDHVLDSGGSETDGRPFYLPEVLTRLQILRFPDDEEALAVLDKGWSACDNCGEYGVDGMHTDWIKPSVGRCMPPSGPDLFASRLADLASFALAPTRKNGHVGGHGVQGLHPTLIEVDEIDDMPPSKLEDLIIPYNHAVPVRTRVTPLTDVSIRCDVCGQRIGAAKATTEPITIDGQTGYLYVHDGPITHDCPMKETTDA